MFSPLTLPLDPGAQRLSRRTCPPSGGSDPGGVQRRTQAVSKDRNTQSNTEESRLQ
jgi:hypothetical protein